ncbi:hypothetical protein K3495_g16299 [Podosphaera aphanis]|nr:hypothetical protein K3495_g16299 [Podosphaera aphanis]
MSATWEKLLRTQNAPTKNVPTPSTQPAPPTPSTQNEHEPRAVTRENKAELNRAPEQSPTTLSPNARTLKTPCGCITGAMVSPTECTTVKHPAYHLVFPDGQKSRTCIYVSKNLAIDKWRKEKTLAEAGGDMTAISLQTDRGKIFINNVYNPPPLSHGSSDLGTLKFLEELLSREGQCDG